MKNLYKKAAVWAMVVVVTLGVTTGAYAQFGAGSGGDDPFGAPGLWSLVDGVVTFSDSTFTLGSASDRIAAVYTDLMDATSVVIGGAVSGDLYVNGNLGVSGDTTSTNIIVSDTVTSTKFDAGLGSAAAPSITLGDSDTGIYSTGANGISFSSGGIQRLAVLNAQTIVYSELVPSGSRNLGGGALRWSTIWGVDGNFSGRVTSTAFIANDGSASAPAYELTDANGGLYEEGTVVKLSQANGLIQQWSTGFSSFNATVAPLTDDAYDNGRNLFRWRNGWYSGTVTSTEFRIADGSSGQFLGDAAGDSAGAPAYSFWDDPDSGLYSNQAGVVGLVANGAVGMLISSTGFTTYRDINPVGDGTLDLGRASTRFQDGWFNGTVTSSRLVVAAGDISNPSIYCDACTNDPGLYFGSSFGVLRSGGTATLQWLNTHLNTRTLQPFLNDTYPLGTTSFRWSDVIAVDGDYSGTVTATNIVATGYVSSTPATLAAYATTTKAISNGSFQPVTLDAVSFIASDKYTYSEGSATTTVVEAGLYEFKGTFHTDKTGGAVHTIQVLMFLDNVAQDNCYAERTVNSTNETGNMSFHCYMNIPASGDVTLKAQANGAAAEFNVIGTGVTAPATINLSMTKVY